MARATGTLSFLLCAPSPISFLACMLVIRSHCLSDVTAAATAVTAASHSSTACQRLSTTCDTVNRQPHDNQIHIPCRLGRVVMPVVLNRADISLNTLITELCYLKKQPDGPLGPCVKGPTSTACSCSRGTQLPNSCCRPPARGQQQLPRHVLGTTCAVLHQFCEPRNKNKLGGSAKPDAAVAAAAGPEAPTTADHPATLQPAQSNLLLGGLLLTADSTGDTAAHH